jgi:hypothetical protein
MQLIVTIDNLQYLSGTEQPGIAKTGRIDEFQYINLYILHIKKDRQHTDLNADLWQFSWAFSQFHWQLQPL